MPYWLGWVLIGLLLLGIALNLFCANLRTKPSKGDSASVAAFWSIYGIALYGALLWVVWQALHGLAAFR